MMWRYTPFILYLNLKDHLQLPSQKGKIKSKTTQQNCILSKNYSNCHESFCKILQNARNETVGSFGPVVAFTTTYLIRLLVLCKCLRYEDIRHSNKEITMSFYYILELYAALALQCFNFGYCNGCIN